MITHLCQNCGALTGFPDDPPVNEIGEMVERLRRGTLIGDNGRGVSEHRSTTLEREAADMLERYAAVLRQIQARYSARL